MIYFIQFEDGGPIKIGRSDQLLARLKHHEKTKGISVILGVHEGDRETERAVHRRFAHLKISTLQRMSNRNALELFHPDPELLAYIAENCEQLELQEGQLSGRQVHVDLPPKLHKALWRAAADAEMSMAALARKIIAEHLGFTDLED